LIDRISAPLHRATTITEQHVSAGGQNSIEPRDLLWGLLQVPESQAAQLIAEQGVDVRSYSAQLQALPAAGDERPSMLTMTRFAEHIIQTAMRIADQHGSYTVTTGHVLLAFLDPVVDAQRGQINLPISQQQAAHGLAALSDEALYRDPLTGQPAEAKNGQLLLHILGTVSPVFLALLMVTIAAGIGLYSGWLNTRLMALLFVLGGWIVALSLHEFGHAIVAYLGGDYSVVQQGYLTLNPLKYTHPVLSIVMPVILLVIGGIGLPGGAVYINLAYLRSRRWHSYVSAGGPLASLLTALALAFPLVTGIVTPDSSHLAFWSAYSVLTFIGITALFFNLLPIPGLDGFGIFAPFLPPALLARVRGFSSFTLIAIFLIFWTPNPLNDAFWGFIFGILQAVQLDFNLVRYGLELISF
jgi:Zn-dependent protease